MMPTVAATAEPTPAPTAACVINRPLVEADLSAVRALHDDVFGPGRFARTAYRVREGTADISPFCLGAFAGPDLVAALRMTEIAIGRSRPDLLLGPLAVARAHAGQGFGKALVADGLKAAERAGIGVVVLVGDLGYYQRFGFAPVPSAQIIFPGPVDPRRILAVELRPGALVSARGLVTS